MYSQNFAHKTNSYNCSKSGSCSDNHQKMVLLVSHHDSVSQSKQAIDGIFYLTKPYLSRTSVTCIYTYINHNNITLLLKFFIFKHPSQLGTNSRSLSTPTNPLDIEVTARSTCVISVNVDAWSSPTSCRALQMRSTDGLTQNYKELQGHYISSLEEVLISK